MFYRRFFTFSTSGWNFRTVNSFGIHQVCNIRIGFFFCRSSPPALADPAVALVEALASVRTASSKKWSRSEQWWLYM